MSFLAVMVGLLFSTRISDKYTNRISGIQKYEQDASAMGKVATNHAAIDMLKRHPTLGVGAGNFNELFIDYVPDDLKEYVREGKSVHNMTLQVASETGLIGLFIFSLLIFKSFIDVLRLKKLCNRNKNLNSLGHTANALGIGWFGYFLAGQFIPGAYYSYFYVFLPLIACALEIGLEKNGGDILSTAFAYQIYKENNPSLAQGYANNVIEKMKSLELKSGGSSWGLTGGTLENVALAFDWIYDAMSKEDVNLMIDKIASVAKFSERKNERIGETFHIEEWCFSSYNAWPEIALAHHHPDAEKAYLDCWTYTAYWGDAARAIAYIADGTDFEGYRYYYWELMWFLALKSATGINLIDSEDFPYFKMAAYYHLYRTDFAKQREVFHRWTSNLGGGGGLTSLKNWKNYNNIWSIASVAQEPCCQWYLNQLPSNKPKDWFAIILESASIPEKNPSQATWNELPLSIHFRGGNEVYMRTGWEENDVVAALRVTPAWTMNSHGHSEANTFVLYRKGNLAMDSGVYDAYSAKVCYEYQKSTTAHNNILVIDPRYASSEASTLGEISKWYRSWTFGAPYEFRHGWKAAFLHRPESNWGDIVTYEANKEYVYAIGEAAKAYGIDNPVDPDIYNVGDNHKRLEEYERSIVFIPKGTKAYFIVFDRIESVGEFEKRWLLHLVGEPHITGNKISEEIPGHIETYNSEQIRSENGLGAVLYLKNLLPQQSFIRKIGGDGYEFWKGGKNYPIGGDNPDPNKLALDINLLQECIGGQGRIEEIGEWRIEIAPLIPSKRDLFFNVIYVADADETLGQVELKNSTINELMYGSYIIDESTPWFVMFSAENDTVSHLAYSLDGDKTISQLICDLPRSSNYEIKVNGTLWSTGQTSSQGTLYFKHNPNGTAEYEILVGPEVFVDNIVSEKLPENLCLQQNYPNPFNGSTVISYQISNSLIQGRDTVFTSLNVYNLTGQLVRILVYDDQNPGQYKVTWDGKDEVRESVSSGVYLYKLRVRDTVATRKLVLLR